MNSFNKKVLFSVIRLVCLMLVASVLLFGFSACGEVPDDLDNEKSMIKNREEAVTDYDETPDDSGNDMPMIKGPKEAVIAFSEAYSKGDFATSDNLSLYVYDDVMVAATGKYPSAEEYRKTTYVCASNEEYYQIIADWTGDFLEDTYGEDYTVKATVNSCEKLDEEKTQNIKDYYTKFYEACGIDSSKYFSIDGIKEIYVATCTCKISGELEESSTDEVYFVYKTGEGYKVILCNGVTEDNVDSLIDNIPARTSQLEGLVGQGAFKDQPTFNEYFYILGLQN